MGNPDWTLVSAEERADREPGFQLPSRERRESLEPGDAAKLLFDIETREGGEVVDCGVDRMWVIVRRREGARYVGVLDSDPGTAENLSLERGANVVFGPEHIVELDRPPRSYVVEHYGAGFFS